METNEKYKQEKSAKGLGGNARRWRRPQSTELCHFGVSQPRGHGRDHLRADDVLLLLLLTLKAALKASLKTKPLLRLAAKPSQVDTSSNETPRGFDQTLHGPSTRVARNVDRHKAHEG